METNVGIGVDPVSTWDVTAIDYRDRCIRMREQRIDERHPGGPCTDDEIVRFESFVPHWMMRVVAVPGHHDDIDFSGERSDKRRSEPAPQT